MTIQCFESRIFNLVKEAVLLEYNFVVGGSGVPQSLKGGGVSSVERLAAGVYRVTLDRTYNRVLGRTAGIIAPMTGSAIADGSFTPGTMYRITAVGTTDFVALGAKANVLGDTFIAASAGGSGTGTAKEVIVATTMAIQSVSAISNNVSHFVFQCVDKSGAVAEAPAGCLIAGQVLLRRSSLKGQGE